MPHKPSYQQAIYILISNDGDDPTWFISTHGFYASMPHKDTNLAIQKAIYLFLRSKYLLSNCLNCTT